MACAGHFQLLRFDAVQGSFASRKKSCTSAQVSAPVSPVNAGSERYERGTSGVGWHEDEYKNEDMGMKDVISDDEDDDDRCCKKESTHT